MMSQNERRITPDDVQPPAAYAATRRQRRRQIIEIKKHRRVAVGPDATLYFENYDTMLQQVQEMLWIEKGGAEQLADELAAYNPLIPQGDELVATLMFEIGDEARRRLTLARLAGVEATVAIELEGEAIAGEPELGDRIERTTAAGKTSSIHFLHFRFTPAQIERFRDPAVRAVVAIGHPGYAHMAVVPPEVRAALAADFT
jgi:hypothetical protein